MANTIIPVLQQFSAAVGHMNLISDLTTNFNTRIRDSINNMSLSDIQGNLSAAANNAINLATITSALSATTSNAINLSTNTSSLSATTSNAINLSTNISSLSATTGNAINLVTNLSTLSATTQAAITLAALSGNLSAAAKSDVESTINLANNTSSLSATTSNAINLATNLSTLSATTQGAITLANLSGNLASAARTDVLNQIVIKTGIENSIGFEGFSAVGWGQFPVNAFDSGTETTVTYGAAYASKTLLVVADLVALRTGWGRLAAAMSTITDGSGPTASAFEAIATIYGDYTGVASWDSGYPLISWQAIGY